MANAKTKTETGKPAVIDLRKGREPTGKGGVLYCASLGSEKTDNLGLYFPQKFMKELGGGKYPENIQITVKAI